ncbi:hypothetical protein AB6A40_005066 [Gnathostoma spinigerum]|uniref:Uncharacterized protein n=1 Tax=Gnathostoma spinigerum TaxID=75299 RepID=A0ABD6EGJ0_9BILA
MRKKKRSNPVETVQMKYQCSQVIITYIFCVSILNEGYIMPYFLHNINQDRVQDALNVLWRQSDGVNAMDTDPLSMTWKRDGHEGHMLKQPLLRFDILWKKFAGRKRFIP